MSRRASVAARLPPQVHVFVRDWLSSNNIVLKDRDGAVVIDSGYGSQAPLTLALIASRQGLDGAPLAKLVNTHCHSDHIGGNAAIARAYDCPIALPASEAPLVDAWDTKTLLLDYAVGETLEAGATYVWGGLEWRALAAPGHDMAALVFYNTEHRILISGDALWRNGYGFVMPPEIDPAAMPATRATLEMLSALDIRVVIPGHGEPFTDVEASLERAARRFAAFDVDPTRMALADLPAYVDRVPIFRDFNARFFASTPVDLAASLVDELERVGAVRRSEGFLTPA